MPKVSIFASDLCSAVSIRAHLLALALLEIGYNVEVVGFQSGPTLYAEPPERVVVRSVSGGILPGILLKVPELLGLLDGDYIYAIKPKPTSFGIGPLRRWQTKKPLLLDIDDWELSWCGGDDWRYSPSSLKQRYRDIFKTNGQLREPGHPLYIKWLERCLDRVHGLTVNTTFLQKRLGGYLPNGKDIGLFNPDFYNPEQIRSQLGFSDYRILMLPGAPRPHKGVEDVLDALELLNQDDL